MLQLYVGESRVRSPVLSSATGPGSGASRQPLTRDSECERGPRSERDRKRRLMTEASVLHERRERERARERERERETERETDERERESEREREREREKEREVW